ncbi:MAG TPA: flagellar hook-basal body protein [Solirubrobacteraceae bacterium]|jgi:flagellar basal-body rod protein FlgG|nr:flagellar hook-basal body protein [Solirubrobacteraceae bacterium]
MLEGLFSAAAGMNAQQEELDAIGNDLANVNTTGYKAQRTAFSDLLYNQVEDAGTNTTAGAGARESSIGRVETQGSMKETGNPLDLAIVGDGYFVVTLPGGKSALTRDGSFGVDASGTLTNSSGYRLSPRIQVPKGVAEQEVRVADDGTVSAAGKRLGKLSLVTVDSPAHLLSDGGNLFNVTEASGAAHAARDATIQAGSLEESNVDMSRELTALVTTQRAFQMTSTAVQNESQMMAIANQLRPA